MATPKGTRERSRNRIRSLIDELPAEERKLLDDMLADVRYTYQQISDTLGDRGIDISKSSIGRYAMRSHEAANRLREIHDRTEQLVRAVKDGQDLQSADVATSIMMDMLVQRIATAEDEIDKVPLAKVATILTQLQRAAVYKNRYKDTRLKSIRTLEGNIMQRLRDLVQGDDELLDRLILLVQEAAKEEVMRDAS